MSSRSTSSESSSKSSSDQPAGKRDERGARKRKPKRVRATLLPALLAGTVERDPSAVAIVDGSRSITYSELDVHSSKVARYLVSRGAGPESVVAVAATRSIESITAIWAVVKSGAAFLPVDPSYPSERIRHMIVDSGATQGITTSAYEGSLPESCEWWAVDGPSANDDLRHLSGEPISTVERTSTLRATNPAYVIYTSGSTGVPKGVVVTHAGLGSLCAHAVRVLGLSPLSRTLHFTSPSFDVSVFDYLIAVGSGGTMVIAPPDNFGGHELVELLERERITHGFATPAALTSIDGTDLTELEALVVGGEAFGPDLVAKWAPGRSLFNGYGPTEATIFATMSAPLCVGEPITMGDPVEGTKAYVLDARLAAVPPGVAGELYLAGSGIARGYHERSALTAARFVADPRDPSGGRMYRTGDLVKTDASGKLEYLGRNDFQVKIRGFRIELGEIDAALAAHPDVDFALTTGVESGAGNTTLVSYALPVPGASPDTSALLEWMGRSLPGHMVPSALVLIDHVPLTGAGKVDRAALPAPVFASREYRPPTTHTEQVVAEVFAELLGRDRVGSDDDFFELGGNSLIGTQVAARVGARLRKQVPARMLFDEPSVSGLAAAVDAHGDERPLGPTSGARPDRIPLSPTQEQMWHANLADPLATKFNIPVVVRLSGPLDENALTAAIADVVARHETLRTVYPSDELGPRQVVSSVEDAAVEIHVVETTESRLHADVLAVAGTAFDVTTEIPIRVALMTIDDTEHVLAVVAHHIAADGYSMNPLAADILTAYAARHSGVAPAWAPLAMQYADYTLWKREILGAEDDESSKAAEQKRYWAEQLTGLDRCGRVPVDFDRPAESTNRGRTVDFTVPAEVHRDVAEVARGAGATVFMLVHAVVATVLGHLSGSDDIAVRIPIAGRGAPELDGLIGKFNNSLVLRTTASESATFADLLAHVREVDLGAFARSDLPFERVMAAADPTGTSLPVQTTLSFQNLGWTGIRLPDVEVVPVDIETGIAKYELQFVFKEGPSGELDGSLLYSTDLFELSTAQKMVDLFIGVVTQASSGLSIDVRDALGITVAGR